MKQRLATDKSYQTERESSVYHFAVIIRELIQQY